MMDGGKEVTSVGEMDSIDRVQLGILGGRGNLHFNKHWWNPRSNRGGITWHQQEEF